MKREKWVEKIDYGYSAQRSNEAAPAHFLFLLTPKKPTAYSHLCPILLVSLFPLITIQKKFTASSNENRSKISFTKLSLANKKERLSGFSFKKLATRWLE